MAAGFPSFVTKGSRALTGLVDFCFFKNWVYMVHTPNLTKMSLKETKITSRSLQETLVFLVADGQSNRNEAGHLLDARISKFLSGTKSHTSQTSTCVVVNERPDSLACMMVVAISSSEIEGV